MDTYEHETNVNNKQRAQACSAGSRLQAGVLKRECTCFKSSQEGETLRLGHQLIQRWWDLLFDFLRCHHRACAEDLRQSEVENRLQRT